VHQKMKITIEVVGPLRDDLPVESKNGLRELSFRYQPSLSHVVNVVLHLGDVDKIVLVNGKYVTPHYSLNDGDRVQIFSPLPGG
jgi:molybdopterin converting factor small subunit